ncbi:MAG: class I SAM-dependent methyltransferase, partial [Actinobacteria bacterium]|nr:class I SAM-dependent methyltransferase [Actinomycetota bacterium]
MSIFRWTAPLLQFAARRWSEDDFRLLADRLAPFVPRGGVLADLGGGTGDLGLGVARALGARVVVVDPIEQMLLRVPADPLASVCLATAEALPFPEDYLDGLLCCDAFHHFKDQDIAAAEMARVVRTGGGILILDAAPVGVYRAVAAAERLLGEPAGFRKPDDL